MKNVIVNLIDGDKGGYIMGQKRLLESVQSTRLDSSEYDFRCFSSATQVGSPAHIDNPYAFKIYSIEKMMNEGYQRVFWVDASIVLVKDFSPIFSWLEEVGFFFEAAGHWVGTWSNDFTLKYFNISREEAMTMPMFSAGLCGFDFSNPIAVEFFEKWKQSMLAGCFKGSWEDHRHDMTCGSIIANQMDLVKNYSSAGNYFAYQGAGYGQAGPNVIAHLIGI